MSSKNNDQSNSSPNDDSGDKLTECLLSQYRFSAGGVGLGTAYTLKYKRGFIPMIAAGAIGTTADMVYGYLVECAEFRKEDDSNGR